MRRSIFLKLALTILCVALPEGLFLGFLSYYSLERIDKANEELEQISVALNNLSRLNISVTDASIYLYSSMTLPDQESTHKFQEALSETKTRMATCSTLVCHATSMKTSKMVDELRPEVSHLEKMGARLLPPVQKSGSQQSDPDEKPQKPGRRLTPVELRMTNFYIGQVASEINKMSLALNDRIQELRLHASTIRENSRHFLIGTTLLMLIIGGILAFLLSKTIASPLKRLVTATTQIRQGDFSVRLPHNGRHDEIGQLQEAFNVMVQDLEQYKNDLENLNRNLNLEIQKRTDELRQKEEVLIQQEKLSSIGLLSSSVAHEINNPLTSILMYTDLVLEEVSKKVQESPSPVSPTASRDRDILDDLNKIEQDALRCKKIVEELKNLGKPSLGERVFYPMNQLLDDTLDLLHHELTRRQIQVLKVYHHPLPSVLCYPTRIQQVLINLLMNAVQAIGSQGTVTLRTQSTPHEVQIIVEDTGPGIHPSLREKLFTRFFSTKQQGLGLGLAISKSILEEHQGSLEYQTWIVGEHSDDPSSHGTRFTIHLPRSEPVEDPSHEGSEEIADGDQESDLEIHRISASGGKETSP